MEFLCSFLQPIAMNQLISIDTCKHSLIKIDYSMQTMSQSVFAVYQSQLIPTKKDDAEDGVPVKWMVFFFLWINHSECHHRCCSCRRMPMWSPWRLLIGHHMRCQGNMAGLREALGTLIVCDNKMG